MTDPKKIRVDLETTGKIQSSVQGLYIGSFTTMPTAQQSNVGCTVFYNGNTNTYVRDTYYTCINNSGSYEWVESSTSLTKQIGYYDQSIVYMQNSVVMYNKQIYISIQDNNINHLPTDQLYWKTSSEQDTSTYKATITGDGSTSTWTLTHGLGEMPISVMITYGSTSTLIQVDTVITTTTITVTTAEPLDVGETLNISLVGKTDPNKYTASITGDGVTKSWTIAHPFGTVPNSVLVTFSDGSIVEVGVSINSSNVIISTSLPLDEGEILNVLIAI